MAAAAGLAGCASHGPLGELERTLARQDSATAALGEWCAAHAIADPPSILAQRITGEDIGASAEIRGLLAVGDDEPLGYRHVRLSCGAKTLSIAHNWYVPARLPAAMIRALDTGDTPFGKVVAPLGFTRERLASRHGAAPGCPSGTILSNRAVLKLSDGRPISLVVECYTRANLR